MNRLAVYDVIYHNFFLDCLSGKRDVLSGIDIEKEYELIKQKKSKLSSNMRRMIVLRYERIKEQ